MSYLQSPIYRTVAVIKALMIAGACHVSAVQYLREHNFSDHEIKEIFHEHSR